MKRGISLMLFLIMLFSLYSAEPDTTEPVPYNPEEFKPWQNDLRRAEIIAFGSLPFVTFMTSLGYDVYRYYSHNQREEYLPWPLKNNEIAEPLSQDEQKRILLISVGISVGVALFDFGYRSLKRHIRQSRQDRQNQEECRSIVIEEIDTPVAEETEETEEP